MLDMFDITGIVHFGIAGNVNNSMSIGDVTIPKQFAHTGIWDWLVQIRPCLPSLLHLFHVILFFIKKVYPWQNPNGTLPTNDIAELDFGSYNVPKGDGMNLLGKIGYSYEQFFSESGKPNTAIPLFWAQISEQWLQLAAGLEVNYLDLWMLLPFLYIYIYIYIFQFWWIFQSWYTPGDGTGKVCEFKCVPFSKA